MGKPKPKMTFKPGDAIYVDVDRDRHVKESDPCNKDNCMLSRAFGEALVKTYGGKASDYKVKSTNHGCAFQLGTRKYLAVFDTQTAARIYKYDEIFKSTRDKERAVAGVKSFKTRLMIEASSKIVKKPAMTTEVRKHLRSLPGKPKDAPYAPRAGGSRRELSL